ncbi:helix-turn-helix domain-containing protein [Cyanobacteria bacterium FACHB-472]|nr:helix-turn-helix domain-containing protein [Cyanobacteria bacterium FACHB-472]
MSPRPLTEREQTLIDLYGYCQLGMTPQQFYSKWQVNHEAIAFICSRSMSTVRCWFRRGKSYRRPMSNDLRHLALMDFLLQHWENIPEELKNRLCSTDKGQ